MTRGGSAAPVGRTFPNDEAEMLKGLRTYIWEDAPEEILDAIGKWWPGE